MNTETNTPGQLPLRDGEQLIWQGRPGQLSAPKTKRIAATAAGLLLGIVWLAAQILTPGNLPDWVPGNIHAFLSDSLTSLVLLIFAIGFLLYPIIIRLILSRTHYIVTDQRLITLAIPGQGTATLSLSAENLDKASLWYSTIQHATLHPTGNGLCNLHLWSTPTSTENNSATGILYLPPDIAEYICTRCRRETTP